MKSSLSTVFSTPVLLLFSALMPIATADDVRLNRTHLLQYRAQDGSVTPVQTPADWQHRRREIVSGMQQVMGPMPPDSRRVDLAVQVEEEADAGSYVRRLITYQSEPGSRTPAYLCIPKDVLNGKRRASAVLCLHPTDNTVGHQVVVGLGGRAGRQYAAELAERGYVTVSPSYPHLADYWPNLGKLGYASGTMKAIWDNTRALDLLQSLDYVDSDRGFGAIGHSLGGHNAIYTAVLDDRISAVASSCGFDAYPDYMDGTESVWYFGKGWCQIRYMPRLTDYRGRLEEIPYDFPELLAALAPRPLFVNAPLHDSNFRWRSVDVCANAARPVYQLLCGEDRMDIRHPDCQHDFPEDMRRAAYELFDSVLLPPSESAR
ncbi:MAG: acetylxylan esterase [Fuerstiella sp.]